MKDLIERDKWIPLLLGVLALVLYSATRSHSLASIDAGELATVQLTLGISHPSGYPLFTMVGHLWSKLPLGMTAISQLNLLATFYCAVSIPFFFQAFLSMLPETRENKRISLVAASAGTLALMVSPTFWSVSTGTEVYSLQLLLMSIVLWLVMRAVDSEKSTDRIWIYIACALALGFSNHLTTVILLPAIAFLFFSIPKSGKGTVRTLLKGTVCFLIIVTITYSYLYIRANQNPFLNWGDPDTLSTLWFHVRAKQYSIYTFESLDIAWENLRFFISSLPKEFSIVGIALAIYGAYNGLKLNRRVAIFLLICFITNIALAINYNIPDLGPYFIIAYIVISAFISFGIYRIASLRIIQFSWLGAGLLGFAIPFFLCLQNYDGVDQSDNYVLEDYITNALTSVEKNAIILSVEFENDISPAYYVQKVEGLRNDVVVIDFLSLISQHWYTTQLENNHLEFVESVRQAFDMHRYKLEMFVQNDQESLLGAKESFKSLIYQIVESHFSDRPVYISHGVYRDYLRPGGEVELPFPHWIIPQTFYYRVLPMRKYHALETKYNEPTRYPEYDDSYTVDMQKFGKLGTEVYSDLKHHIGEIRMIRALMIDHRIQYEIKHEKWIVAHELFENLEKQYPAYVLDPRVLKALNEKQQIR